jgi:predicted RNase H-like HicB family nuclease
LSREIKETGVDDMKTYRFPIIIEKDEDGYFASCPSLQGCYTQGETYEEALENIKDAIRLHLEDRLAEGEEISQPESVSLTSIEIAA